MTGFLRYLKCKHAKVSFGKHTKTLTPYTLAQTGSIELSQYLLSSIWRQMLNKCIRIHVRYIDFIVLFNPLAAPPCNGVIACTEVDHLLTEKYWCPLII